MKMYTIITGDIVHSRGVDVKDWLPALENSLTRYSKNFDIFRGDSFQIEIEPEYCVEFLFYLKAKMKSLVNLDVRMAVGVGSITYRDKHIKNSNGDALIYSGEAFDELNKELFRVKSPWADWDELTNVLLPLSMELVHKWTKNMAETVAVVLENPAANQMELATILKRSYQSQVSTELTKANWTKIKKAIDYCTKELLRRC